jgi:uncharacterized protein YutE (UPF0331/DUF86 family)
MIDESLLDARLQTLAESVSDLLEHRTVSLPELKQNKELRRYLERTLHMAVESCLEIGSQLITDLNLREPEDNKEILVVLCESGYLPAEKMISFKRLVHFRNMLVHSCTDTDPEILYNTLPKSLVDIQCFLSSIMKNCLERRGPAPDARAM